MTSLAFLLIHLAQAAATTTAPAVTDLSTNLPIDNQGTVWMPSQASTTAHQIDALFHFILYLCVFFFVLIIGCMFYFMGVYRRRHPEQRALSNATHNTPLELAWSILPGFLLVIMFWWGFTVFLDVRTSPADGYAINVNAQQWSWSFGYPNGHEDNNLHVPVNTNILLTMNSADVLHSFYVPSFRVKMDVVPGRYTKTWFNANKTGEYMLLCAEYCGKQHSDMNAKVIVHPKEDFPVWLANADPLSRLTEEQLAEFKSNPDKFIKGHPELQGLEPPASLGRKLWDRKGCKTCHSLDGATNTGPTFKGVWGIQQPLRDGSSILVDENFVRDSILNPNKNVAKGYDAVMPTYQGRVKDREIDMIIAMLKSLSEKETKK